jgi:hypothetical protein
MVLMIFRCTERLQSQVFGLKATHNLHFSVYFFLIYRSISIYLFYFIFFWKYILYGHSIHMINIEFTHPPDLRSFVRSFVRSFIHSFIHRPTLEKKLNIQSCTSRYVTIYDTESGVINRCFTTLITDVSS